MTDTVDFSLTQLRYFVESAELGSISEAADRLCASQSTVSSAVMKLERQLGVQLFVRHHARGVTLTSNGRHLLREARALLRQARNLKAQGDALTRDTAGQLDVGFFSPIAPFLLPSVCRLATQRYGELRLAVHEATEGLLDLLRDGRCELAVTYDFLAGDHTFHPLADLPVQAVVAEDDPAGRSGPVALAEFADRPLVTLDIPAVVEHVEKMFANAGVLMPQVITTASLETMRGLVAAGAGFALTYQRASSSTTLDGGTVRSVEILGDAPPARVGVAVLRDHLISGRGRAFLDVLESAVSVGRHVNLVA